VGVAMTLSFAKDYYEARTGRRLLGGEMLTGSERSMAMVGAVLAMAPVVGPSYKSLAAASESLAIFEEVSKAAKVEARAGSAVAGELAGLDEAVIGAGRVLDGAKNAKTVTTPFGDASQAITKEAIIARVKVESKQTMYRIGTRGTSQTGTKAQFWSLEHPKTPGYADRHGIKIDNVKDADFIETAELGDGREFITRHAPAWGDAKGGAIEVVVPEGGVKINSHSSLEPGWWE